MFDDTIAAISTALGEGGLAVIRISGAEAVTIADRCFRPAAGPTSRPSRVPSHTLHFGHVFNRNRRIDEVLLAVLRAPRTFTREDTVEISCHGGVLPAKLILDTVLAHGARPAEPGEFTQRAFLNGRIDLAQAEAVADVIHSRTELALLAANEQLAGRLSSRINQLRDEIMRTLAHVEAHIDFPDEDITPDTHEQLLAGLRHAIGFVGELLATADEGRILRRGIRAAIVGRPNVGKSSLLNQLLGRDRAIVTPLAGTTRDTIEETANIRGVPVVFVDTAGLRESEDTIEREGVRRSREALSRSEMVLQVIDASEPLQEEDRRFCEDSTDRKRLLVLNKTDLPRRAELAETPASRSLQVSCLTGAGIEPLKDAIKELVWTGSIGAEMLEVAINSRHQDALRRALQALSHTVDAMKASLALDLVAVDLRIAVNAIGEIVGKTTTEDLLDSVFSSFCIGK